jgi:hypothetical protein
LRELGISGKLAGKCVCDGAEPFPGRCGLVSNGLIGRRALQFHTDGDYNTAAGYNALANGATGNYNSAFGTYALYFNTADGNVAVGYDALLQNTSGTV